MDGQKETLLRSLQGGMYADPAGVRLFTTGMDRQMLLYYGIIIDAGRSTRPYRCSGNVMKRKRIS